MEGTMTYVNGPLFDVMVQAKMPGGDAGPAALLAAVDEVEDPIKALTDNHQARRLFDAFDSEFSFIRSARATGSPLQLQDQSSWVSLMRWFIRELCEWRIEADPDKRKLVTIFVVAQVCDWENKLWDWVRKKSRVTVTCHDIWQSWLAHSARC